LRGSAGEHQIAKSGKPHECFWSSAAGNGLTAAAGDVTADGATLSKGIGTEMDLSANYMHSDNVNFKLGYAEFKPDSNSAALGNGARTDKVTKLFANAYLKF
jgi:hypothetical protein